MKQRICEIASGIAGTFRARAEVVFTGECPSLINDAGLVKAAKKYTQRLLGKEWVYDSENTLGDDKMSGSEDFAYVSQKVPSVMLALAAGRKENDYPLHHPKVSFDTGVLAIGSAVYAGNAIAWLREHGKSGAGDKGMGETAK